MKKDIKLDSKKHNKKDNKKEKKVIHKNVLEVVPIRYYDDELEAFVLKNNSIEDILRVIPRDLSNISEDEMEMEMYEFMKVLKLTDSDIKLVSMNFPLNLDRQKNALKYHQKKAEDEVRVKWLEREIEELELAEKNVNTLTFYLIFFGKNKKDFLKVKDNILKYTTSGINPLCEEISKFKKAQILNKLCNMNTIIDLNELEEISYE